MSPTDTNGTSAYQTAGGYTAVLSDDQVVFGGGPSPAGATQSGNSDTGLATRGAAGWATSSILPSQIDPGEYWTLLDATSSLSTGLFSVQPVDQFALPLPGQSDAVSLVDRDMSGQFETVYSNVYGSSLTDNFGGLSGDGSTVVYYGNTDPAGNAPSPGGAQLVYAWHPGGSVSVIAGGTGDALSGCAPTTPLAPNVVSTDGATVFLQGQGTGAPNCPSQQQIYVSIDGHSEQISAPTDGTPDPQSSASYADFDGATPNGDTAYFDTSTPLTSSAGTSTFDELYQWTSASGGSPASVTCVSCAITADAGIAGSSAVLVSAQGNYVYFTANNPNPAPDGSNRDELIVAHDGQLAIVDSDESGYDLNPQQTQVSPEGSTIVFTKSAANGSSTDLYRSVINGATASAPQCITCGEGGGADPAMSVLGDGIEQSVYQGAGTIFGSGDDAISADGNTVVFGTPDALGTDDASDQIYEWTPQGGDQFVADGDAGHVGGADITPDGQNVFFYSSDALTSTAEQPGVPALYDARVDGGFPTPVGTATCSGDGCQGVTPPGAAPPVGSSSGCCGDLRRGATPRVSLLDVSNASLERASRTGRLTLRVRSTVRGRLRLTVVATLDHHTRRVAAATRGIVDPAKGVVLSVRLSAPARLALNRSGRLSLRVAVSLAGARTRTKRLTLKAVGQGRSGGRS